MTSRERIFAALNHKALDRTPIFEYVLKSPIADRLLGRKYVPGGVHWGSYVQEQGWERAVRQAAIDRVEMALILGHDMLYIPPSPLPPTPSHAGPARTDKHLDPVEIVIGRNKAAVRSIHPRSEQFLIYPMIKEEMDRRGVDSPSSPQRIAMVFGQMFT